MAATETLLSAGDHTTPTEDWAGWLRLQHTAGLGVLSARALLDRYGTPAQLFCAAAGDRLAGLSAAQQQALAAPLTALGAAQLELLQRWVEQPRHHVLTLQHGAYPPLLRHIPDPPLLLYVIGDPALLSAPALAVVGSRNASLQGLANAEHFGAALSAAGLTIVSGLALGIDAAAHRGGLSGAGSTVAVIGTGADRVYPRANQALAHAIGARGCIVSEYGLGTPASAGNFPRRNRVISGLALGVLVVEAALKSGSLVTARMALEQNRDVFAIPGSIHATLAKGCHQLIKAGAKLVESADDVLSELQLAPGEHAPPAQTGPPPPAAPLQALLMALGHDPVAPDLLAQRTGLAPAPLLGQLLALELSGHIERLPGGLFQRRGA